MWIVMVYGVKHSAWKDKEEANHKALALRHHGYKGIKVVKDANEDVENGFYYDVAGLKPQQV